MIIYRVGGAVRDKYLGLPAHENDWVVVGATPDDLLRLGYKQVGKEFPVFLHPETAEEYALARTERKVAPGYTGFTFDASPQVTLEEDLSRRDLTINAMAETPAGELIDPYHGQDDLHKKILRHVSPAFSEDPVRILRVARFAARYARLGFKVAPETNALMQAMVASGEVNALVPERVWKELERALGETSPTVFFEVLADCNALPVLFPMIDLNGPGMTALQQAANTNRATIVRFAAVMYASPREAIDTLYQRYRLPAEYRTLALLVAQYSVQAKQFSQLSALEILRLFSALDAFRREQRFKNFLLACHAITVSQSIAFPSEKLLAAYQAAKQIDVSQWMTAAMTGPEIGKKLTEKRLAAIAAWQTQPEK